MTRLEGNYHAMLVAHPRRPLSLVAHPWHPLAMSGTCRGGPALPRRCKPFTLWVLGLMVCSASQHQKENPATKSKHQTTKHFSAFFVYFTKKKHTKRSQLKLHSQQMDYSWSFPLSPSADSWNTPRLRPEIWIFFRRKSEIQMFEGQGSFPQTRKPNTVSIWKDNRKLWEMRWWLQGKKRSRDCKRRIHKSECLMNLQTPIKYPQFSLSQGLKLFDVISRRKTHSSFLLFSPRTPSQADLIWELRHC